MTAAGVVLLVTLTWVVARGITLATKTQFAIESSSTLAAGLVLAVFLYWGWDTTVATNEETRQSRRNPGRAAVVSTIILVSIFIVAAVAALSFAGAQPLVDNADDILSVLGTQVLGSPLDKLLVLSVLSSSAATTASVILLAARTSLSMSAHGAAPAVFGRIHERFQTPALGTIIFSVASIVWYVWLTIFNEDVIFDSIAALGLMIAFYYAMTGFACAIYY